MLINAVRRYAGNYGKAGQDDALGELESAALVYAATEALDA
jgi:hypothetical protein